MIFKTKDIGNRCRGRECFELSEKIGVDIGRLLPPSARSYEISVLNMCYAAGLVFLQSYRFRGFQDFHRLNTLGYIPFLSKYPYDKAAMVWDS